MTPEAVHSRLAAAFGDRIEAFEDQLHDPVTRVRAEALHEVCRFLRDEPDLRFAYLRLLTGIDRKDRIEVVYHLFSYVHRHAVNLRVVLDRENPEVDSISDLYGDGVWYERETWDLVGVRFRNHPNLKRIMLPLDWVGHPLRKDYVRPDVYHGIPTSREKVREAGTVTHVLPAMHEEKAEEIDGFMRLNMGPHHPATHGVINFLLETDGELLRKATPDVGYLHRGMEKLAEGIPYLGNMPYTDRVDYLGAMFTNHGWALAVEKLAGIEVPRRADFCRVIASELNRIASHLVSTGSLAMDLGAFTPFIHWLREREKINDIMERICGARLTYNYMRFGGVARDIDHETLDLISRWLDHFQPIFDEFNRLITGNEIFIRRLANVTRITAEEAVFYGLVGPNLRASGIEWDVRRQEPYSIYPEFDFKVVTGQGWQGSLGDAYDRYYCRLLEITESVSILRQAIAAMPEGEIRGKAAKVLKPAANEVYTRVEGPRGECGFYVVADGTDKPYRVRYRTGSFTAMTIMEHLSRGLMIADLVALIGSLDIIAPEIDR